MSRTSVPLLSKTMEYSFKGQIYLNESILFTLDDGIARFSVHSKNSLPFYKQHILLEGLTDSGQKIYLLIDHFYDCGFDHAVYEDREVISVPHIEAVVEACAVMDSGSIDDVDSIGFYSLEVPKITNTQVSGALNDDNASWMDIKKTLGRYKKCDRGYKVSIGFVEERPFYRGQMLVVGADGKLEMDEIKESYWLMKKALTFLYQKRVVPLESVYLRNGSRNIGKLYIERLEHSRYISFTAKCLPVIGWDDKFSNLLQALADNKIHLRHVPIFKEDEKSVTPGRFLMGLVALENILDLTNVHVSHDDKHKEAVESVKANIGKLVKSSTGKEKKIYKRILEQVEKDENFEGRIKTSLEDNCEFVNNFFTLGILGDSPSSIAKDLAKARNALAHGDLDVDLSVKSSYQMHFLMLYVLYLQLEMIGFTKKEASEIVPNILFEH